MLRGCDLVCARFGCTCTLQLAVRWAYCCWQGYLKHVTGDHEFTDASFFYRLFEHPGRTTQRRPRRRSSVIANTAMRAPAADVGVKLGTVPEPDDPVGVDRPGVHIAYDKLPEWARGKEVEELLELTIKSGWMVKQGHKVCAARCWVWCIVARCSVWWGLARSKTGEDGGSCFVGSSSSTTRQSKGLTLTRRCRA